MHFINGKGHNSELKSKRNYLTNHKKSKSCHYVVIYGLGGGYTHTLLHTWQHEKTRRHLCNSATYLRRSEVMKYIDLYEFRLKYII